MGLPLRRSFSRLRSGRFARILGKEIMRYGYDVLRARSSEPRVGLLR
jgi:hypothetical protein